MGLPADRGGLPRSAERYPAAPRLELLPEGPNELWQADVTRVHIPGFGPWYAVTTTDSSSRYRLASQLSPSHDQGTWIVAVNRARAEAERLHGELEGAPTLTTDNGSSLLSRRFRAYSDGMLRQVRPQYRTPQQLGLLERSHRTLERQGVCREPSRSPAEVRDPLSIFRERDNGVRPLWARMPTEGGDPATPADVYRRGVEVPIPARQG